MLACQNNSTNLPTNNSNSNKRFANFNVSQEAIDVAYTNHTTAMQNILNNQDLIKFINEKVEKKERINEQDYQYLNSLFLNEISKVANINMSLIEKEDFLSYALNKKGNEFYLNSEDELLAKLSNFKFSPELIKVTSDFRNLVAQSKTENWSTAVFKKHLNELSDNSYFETEEDAIIAGFMFGAAYSSIDFSDINDNFVYPSLKLDTEQLAFFDGLGAAIGGSAAIIVTGPIGAAIGGLGSGATGGAAILSGINTVAQKIVSWF